MYCYIYIYIYIYKIRNIQFTVVRANIISCLINKKSLKIRVITKLPNSVQSNKGKVKTHKYKQTKSVNNRKTVKTVMTLTWYRYF